MREICLASHGRYAEGIISALSLLVGDESAIHCLCAYCGDIASTAELHERLRLLARESEARGNELVIFTDLQGGSVNNTAMQLLADYSHLHVVSGANLIMLMAFCLSELNDTGERIREAIVSATEAMQYSHQLPPAADAEDFFSVRPPL
ncbi:PTS sugar transporter subunit IIA [Erwinia sp. 198]|uniref:PTS sugar transporter subunit IIA n=1 Tax=Erwinia sp. 198 TaxID=2022746 RepID=UPI000F65C822|nr:PTS fructose transporter subunit IIA [Erwinia sp. 198]RRZ92983.1 PTS fructose transporter subunit IIA [Erwinia sp. 198]